MSDSETDIDKPLKTFNYLSSKPYARTNVVSTSNTMKTNDVSSSEEEQLSMSLLQIPKGKSGISTTGVGAAPKISDDRLAVVQRSTKAPEMSSSESDEELEEESEENNENGKSDDDDDDDDDDDGGGGEGDSVPVVKEKISSPSSSGVVLDRSLELHSSKQFSLGTSLSKLSPPKNTALSEHYMKVCSPPLEIPTASYVWVLQVPRNVPATHLIGQHFPTELKGGETIGASSAPLQVKEVSCDQSVTSINCILASGQSHKIQLLKPRGFWILRRPPISLKSVSSNIPWGAPVVPVPIEELLLSKSKHKADKSKKVSKHKRKSNCEEPYSCKHPTVEASNPNNVYLKRKSKRKCHENNSGVMDTMIEEDVSRNGSKKRKFNTLEDQEISVTKKKKKKKTLESNHDIENNLSELVEHLNCLNDHSRKSLKVEKIGDETDYFSMLEDLNERKKITEIYQTLDNSRKHSTPKTAKQGTIETIEPFVKKKNQEMVENYTIAKQSCELEDDSHKKKKKKHKHKHKHRGADNSDSDILEKNVDGRESSEFLRRLFLTQCTPEDQ